MNPLVLVGKRPPFRRLLFYQVEILSQRFLRLETFVSARFSFCVSVVVVGCFKYRCVGVLFRFVSRCAGLKGKYLFNFNIPPARPAAQIQFTQVQRPCRVYC